MTKWWFKRGNLRFKFSSEMVGGWSVCCHLLCMAKWELGHVTLHRPSSPWILEHVEKLIIRLLVARALEEDVGGAFLNSAGRLYTAQPLKEELSKSYAAMKWAHCAYYTFQTLHLTKHIYNKSMRHYFCPEIEGNFDRE